MASGPQVGDPAPDFALDGTDGPFRLSDQLGRRVVLLFYPGDYTPVCTRQFCSYREREDDLAALDAVVVGISDQDLDSHHGFTARYGLNVPLLADPGRNVARRYGTTAPMLGTRRAAIVVDEDGVVRYRKVHAVGLDYPTVDELRDVLHEL